MNLTVFPPVCRRHFPVLCYTFTSMKISGFTVVRNADKYYFPIRQCIESMLPVVDEVIVALGNCDPADRTAELIRSIPSDKIKIYDRVWDEKLYKDGAVLREETSFALGKCSGDWCIYLQADELLHQDDHGKIKEICDYYLHDTRVQGFLLKYFHFWGDYQHYFRSHAWYPYEIRIVRNHIGVKSHRDAQSFVLADGEKLKVIKTDIRIFHYGWVRPPGMMNTKRKEQYGLHNGKGSAKRDMLTAYFEFGPLGRLDKYSGSHPAVMKEWIKKIDWQDKLNYGKKYLPTDRDILKHEQPKYRLLSFIENNFLNGRQIFGWRNWKQTGKYKKPDEKD
jgi:hypothetical protein